MEPQVTVLVMAYNQERYIAQCLESVLNQATDFPYRVIVSDDAATDGTRGIVRAYMSRYPGKLRALEPEHNVGLQRNCLRLCREAKAPYLAILDGDDFWCGERDTGGGMYTRLQKQFDYLEAHKEYVLCSGRTLIVDDSGKVTGGLVPDEWLGKTYTFEDYFRHPILLHVSGLLRRNVLFPGGQVPDFCYDWPDTPYGGIDEDLHRMLDLEQGPAYILPEVVSAYRYHGHGDYSGRSELEQAIGAAMLTHKCVTYYRSRHPELRDAIRGYARMRYDRLWQMLINGKLIYPEFRLSLREAERLGALLRELAREHANELI